MNETETQTAEGQTSGATVKETSGSFPETGSVAPEASQDVENQAGGSQESSEGGPATSQDVRHRGPTKLDTIRELRSRLREQKSYWEQEMGSVRTQLEELKNALATGQRGEKPSKTFWEAPEEVLNERDERFDSKLQRFRDEILEGLKERESQSQQLSQIKQEALEAAKFIQDPKNGITPEDEEELEEIVRETPAMRAMRPMERAKYALFLWREQKGITDKSSMKAKASTVVGAPPAGGVKMWTEEEMEKELSKLPQDPKAWTAKDNETFEALNREFNNAFKEKRVKK